MKRLCIILLAVAYIGTVSAQEGSDFTWADYEMMCFVRGAEPSYETYIYLVENPQCLEEDSADLIKLLFEGADTPEEK